MNMSWLETFCALAVIAVIICIITYDPSHFAQPNPEVDPEVVEFVFNQTPNGVSVDLCEYLGKKLLLVNVEGDYMAAAYDLDGRLIGYPFGGITGKGDQSFLDWFAYARTIRRLKDTQ